MRRGLRRSIAFVATGAIMGVLGACSFAAHKQWSAPIAPQQPPFTHALVPMEPPPQVKLGLDRHNSLYLVRTSLEKASHTPAISQRIAEANKRFDAGRELLRLSEAEKARAEFDRAIDLLLSAPAAAYD